MNFRHPGLDPGSRVLAERGILFLDSGSEAGMTDLRKVFARRTK